MFCLNFTDVSLTDAVLVANELIDDIGTELFAKGISEGEADQRRRDEEAQQYDEWRAEHILKMRKRLHSWL